VRQRITLMVARGRSGISGEKLSTHGLKFVGRALFHPSTINRARNLLQSRCIDAEETVPLLNNDLIQCGVIRNEEAR
jgi:hypothetical protein